jgi:periplasmic divalent cation tolerance protein
MTIQPYVVVLITTPDDLIAEDIGQVLVEKKLAACVNIVPHVRSIFTWDGSLESENEVLLIVKTTLTIFQEELMSTVKSMHPYDVPEIIALPLIGGDRAYLDWIDEVVEDYQSGE